MSYNNQKHPPGGGVSAERIGWMENKRDVIVSFGVNGMTCSGCEFKIENQLLNAIGVLKVKANYVNHQVDVTFDPSITNRFSIAHTMEELGYQVIEIEAASQHGRSKSKNKSTTMILGIFILIVVGLLLLRTTLDPRLFTPTPGTGYGVLFLFGLISPLFCTVAWSINISVCTAYQSERQRKFSKLRPSLLFNLGRVIAITALGAILGVFGSAIGSAPTANTTVSLIAGVLLVIIGLNMLNLFPTLHQLVPKFPKFLGSKADKKMGESGPFIVGLLSVFIPCGPLQVMQLYALGTGSIASGALAMFLYAVGTLPLMLGFGAVSTIMSEKVRKSVLKIGAALVLLMGIGMLMGALS